jgi:hypothetical protein
MDLKTSLLVYNQLPEFVREEYPVFISFLEAYYEFLEQERYTSGISQKNNLVEKLKELRTISDVDFSLDDFEDQFFSTFASLLPKETKVSKDFLLKNILPLYKSKGTIKSFEFLFKILFNESIQIEYPREQILRASDGKWVKENIIRTELEIYNQYVSDGSKSFYSLPYELNVDDIEIRVNGIIFEDYYVRKENKKIVFTSVPENGSIIKIIYVSPFTTSIFANRQIRGVASGATSIIEKVGRRNLAGSNFYQFFIDARNTIGTFTNGEIIEIMFLDERGVHIPFYIQTFSTIRSVDIINPGRNYKVGDVVSIRGTAAERATAVVGSVSSGNVESITVRVGNFGAGYKVGNDVLPVEYTSNGFVATIDAVDDSGTISPNSFSFNNTDFIIDYLNVNIDSEDYGFPSSNLDSENLTTPISAALSVETITNLGPATNVVISISDIPSNINVEFEANSTLLFDDVRISDFNAIGTIKVVEPGSGYSVGDNVIFTNTQYFSGQGASAFVSSVNSTGGITKVTVTNGGLNYKKEFLPNLSVDSDGTGAVLQIEHFMGQGAEFDYVSGDGVSGKILSIQVLNPGKGYTVTPVIDLKFSGDGTALAVANVRQSFVELPGRWINEDGLLSTDEIRLQGKDYYIDFSYVISSKVEFQRYKNIVKSLLNPSGSINYAKYLIADNIPVETDYLVFDEFSRQVAGTVNVVSNMIEVWGTNTYFEVANSIGILTEGTVIMVNSEIRIVNSIINNTTITVSESFDFNANDNLITIVVPPYRAITTEYWKELALSIEGSSPIVLTTED